MDAASHPALLLVDAISSLGSIDYRHDEWRVDVTVSCSQKGLMLPPGLGFNAISAKALAASKSARLATRVLGLGADDRGQRRRVSFRTRRRRICSTACARPSACCSRKGWLGCSRATRVSRGDATRGRAPGGSRSSRRIRTNTARADGCRHAGGTRRRPAAPDHPRAIRHVARNGTRRAEGQECSASATSATSTT